MSKHFYLIDEKGSFASADGSIRYRLEKGAKGMETVRKMREQQNVRFLEYQDGDDRILIEIKQERIEHHRKYDRREQYIKDSESAFKPVILSLDNTIEVDGEEVVYLDTVASEYDLEKDVISRESIILLKKSLSTLNKEEMRIIFALFLSDRPMSEREYARENAIPQRTLNHRKTAILKKLKVFLEKSGSN
jgi:hypothetical protein